MESHPSSRVVQHESFFPHLLVGRLEFHTANRCLTLRMMKVSTIVPMSLEWIWFPWQVRSWRFVHSKSSWLCGEWIFISAVHDVFINPKDSTSHSCYKKNNHHGQDKSNASVHSELITKKRWHTAEIILFKKALALAWRASIFCETKLEA